VSTPGRSLDYFTLRVPPSTGETPKTGLAPPNCCLSTADKAEAVFIEGAVS